MVTGIDEYSSLDVLKIKKHLKKHRPKESVIFAFKYYHSYGGYNFIFAFTDKAFYCFGWNERHLLTKYESHKELVPLVNYTTVRHGFKAYKQPCQCVFSRLSFEKIKSIKRVDNDRYPNIKPFEIQYYKTKGNEKWLMVLNNEKEPSKRLVGNYKENWFMASADWNRSIGKGLLIPYNNSEEASKIEHCVSLVSK
tara:strand:- start:382 stop:966 length:585 start_codon:yes stop_codon:yes gene_type:complete